MTPKELHTSNTIKRYPINLTQIPIAEQYAEQIEMSLPAHGFVESSKLWADEFRRLSPMEAENVAIKAANKDCVLHFDALKADYDKVFAVKNRLEDALLELLGKIKEPPESRCSCHISPPCNDCVDYAGMRILFRDVHEALKLAGEIE